MKHVIVEPGVCGFKTDVTAEAFGDDDEMVNVTVCTKCHNISKMMDDLGHELNTYEVLGLLGERPLLENARDNYPVHAACAVISGITKCIEAEAGLALPRDASIHFVDE